MTYEEIFTKELLEVKKMCNELEKSIDSFLNCEDLEIHINNDLRNGVLQEAYVFSNLYKLSEENKKMHTLISLSYELEDRKFKKSEIDLIFSDILSGDAEVIGESVKLKWSPYYEVKGVNICEGVEDGSS